MPDEMVTYRYVDGHPVAGGYPHVMSLEWFGDDGDFYEVFEERWKRTYVEVHRFGPTDVWCEVCAAYIALDEPAPPPYLCADCLLL